MKILEKIKKNNLIKIKQQKRNIKILEEKIVHQDKQIDGLTEHIRVNEPRVLKNELQHTKDLCRRYRTQRDLFRKENIELRDKLKKYRRYEI